MVQRDPRQDPDIWQGWVREGWKAVAKLLGELQGRRRASPRLLGEVTVSLDSGLVEQANPRNLIFGICKIEEPVDNSLAAGIAGRSGWREFREFGTEFHLIREGAASHRHATMRKDLGRRLFLCVTGSLNLPRPCSPILLGLALSE